jgi:hypothetical protein
MSRFHGPQQREPLYARGSNKGAQSAAKGRRRRDALGRNSATEDTKRASARRQAGQLAEHGETPGPAQKRRTRKPKADAA